MLAKFIKRAAGFFFGMGLFFLALVFSVSLALNTHDARQMILDKVNALIPGEVSVDHLSVSLFAGSLDARGLVLSGPDKQILVQAKRLYVNLSWTALLFRRLSFENLDIEEPRVFLETDEKGYLNLVEAFSPEEGETGAPGNGDAVFPFNITFGSLAIKDGLLAYAMEGRETVLTENIWVNAGRVNMLRRSGTLSLDLGPCRINWEGLDIGIDHMALSGIFKRKQISSLLLNLVSDVGDVMLRGDVKDPYDHPEPDVFMSFFQKDLARTDKALSLSLGLSGEARVDLHVWGDYENPQGDLTVSAEHAGFLGYKANALAAKAHVADRLLTLHELKLDTPIGQASMAGELDLRKAVEKGYAFSDFLPERATFTCDLVLRDVFPHAFPYVDGIANGSANADIHLSGQGLLPFDMKAVADVKADSKSLSFLETPQAAYVLNGQVSYTNGRLSTSDAELVNGKNTLKLNGEYRFGDFTYDGDLDLVSGDLSSLAFISGYGEYKGRLDLKTRWAYNGDTWSGRFSGQGKAVSVNGVKVGALSLSAVLSTPGILKVESFDAVSRTFGFHGKGSLGLFDDDNLLDLSVDVTGADIPGLLNMSGAKGLADGHVTVTGTLFSPKLDGEVKGHGLVWESLRLGDVNAGVSFEDGRVSWTGMTLKNNRSQIQSQGSLLLLDMKTFSLLSKPSGEISLKSTGLELDDFYGGPSGHVTVDAHVKGRQGDLSGFIRARGDSLKIMDQPIDHVTVSSRLDADDLIVDQAVVSMAQNEDIRLSGRLALSDLGYELAASSDPISLKSFDVIGPQSPCQGKVIVSLNGSGTLDNPGLTGKIHLRDVLVNRESLNGGELILTVADHVARVDGSLIGGIQGMIHLDTYDFTSQVQFDKTVLGPFFRMGGYTDLDGNLTGTVKAWGQLTEPDHIRAQASLTSMAVRNGQGELIRGKDARFDYGDKTFSFPEARFVLLDQGALSIRGKGQMDGSLEILAHGSIPVGIADPFVDELVNITGTVEAWAKVTGTMASPSLSGELDINGVSFLIPEVMQQVHDLAGRVIVKPDQVIIENLTGGLDTGSFDIHGSLGLDSFTPGAVNLFINGESLPFSLPDTMDVTVNTTMTFTGTPDNTQLEGTVMLIEGKYYKDVSMNLINMVTEKTRKSNPGMEPIDIPYLRGLALNVNLKHRNPFDVDNNIAYLELKPDLKIYGTLSQPLVSGRAQVQEGDSLITYQGKDFEVVKGVVDFLNPYKIEPTLDVECETKIRDWTITLTVAGTPENLKFTLTSSPSETDGDILSILLLGKTTAELREGGGESKVSAAKLLSNVLSQRLEKNIRDATGMDTVELEYTNANSETSENGVKVTIGKELSERLTLKYGVETKSAETVQQAIAEYKFMENLMINAYQNTANEYGAELAYRLEFR